MIQRFGDVAIDPANVIAVSRKVKPVVPSNAASLYAADQCGLVIRDHEMKTCVIEISEAGATALLEHFGKKPEA